MATLEAGTTQRNLFPGAWRMEGPDDRVTWHLRSLRTIPQAPALPQFNKERKKREPVRRTWLIHKPG